jgi:hypothetical protein
MYVCAPFPQEAILKVITQWPCRLLKDPRREKYFCLTQTTIESVQGNLVEDAQMLSNCLEDS